MTALTSSLWYLADPKHPRKLVTRAVRFAMIMQYHRVEPGKTMVIK